MFNSSQQLEQGVLGAMLIQNSITPEVMGLIDEEVFFEQKHKDMYRSIVDLYQRDGAVDSITLYEEKIGKIVGATYISGLMEDK